MRFVRNCDAAEVDIPSLFNLFEEAPELSLKWSVVIEPIYRQEPYIVWVHPSLVEEFSIKLSYRQTTRDDLEDLVDLFNTYPATCPSIDEPTITLISSAQNLYGSANYVCIIPTVFNVSDDTNPEIKIRGIVLT